jgi:hypothetical protein
MMVNELNMTLGKVILLSVLIVLAGVGMVYALGYEFTPKNATQTSPIAEGSANQSELNFTLQLQKTNYSLGEPINITLTFTNISNQTINFTYSMDVFDFLVYNGTNNVIYQWSWSKIFPYYMGIIPLAPGENFTESFVWPQITGPSTINPSMVSLPVSPGTYYIVGQMGTLQTTPIQVTISSSSPSPSTGTLFVIAFYAVKQPDGSYKGSYVEALITVIGPENHTGITTTDPWNPLNFTVAPGQYSVVGTYDSITQNVTVNVSAGSYGVAFLNFGSSPPPPLSLPPTAEGVNDGLKLTMTLEKTEYTIGEPVNITLTITNISNQTTTIGLSAYNDFDFRVYNGTNSTLYQWSNRWIGVAVPQVIWLETLNAGESLSENLAWSQTCYNTGLSEGVPVSPGEYHIVGQIGSILSGKNSTIETTPIQVTIVKP